MRPRILDDKIKTSCMRLGVFKRFTMLDQTEIRHVICGQSKYTHALSYDSLLAKTVQFKNNEAYMTG